MTDKNSSGYFVMYEDITDTSARITGPDNLHWSISNWIGGAPIGEPVPTPLVFTLVEEDDEHDDDDDDPDEVKGQVAAYYSTSAPLMSNELIETLQSCGVDNLEIHDAVIREESTGKEFHTHRAVNIIGLIAMADKSKSQTSSIGGLAQWVHKMVPDAAAARGNLLFRLQEGPSQIIVHEKIKDAVEARELPLIYFVPLEDFSG